MTTGSTTALAAVPAPRAPWRPRGLTWAVLRLHRAALLLWAATLAAFALVSVWMYVIGDEARRGIGACADPPTGTLPSCGDVAAIAADDTYAIGIGLLTGALAYVVFPVTAWAAGALTGRELEHGTARLAWAQSVTPVRWLTARLALPAALLTAGTAAAHALLLWARGDDEAGLVGDWYMPDVYLAGGPTALAYPLAGLALGALAGLLTGRATAGAGLALAVWLVLYNALDHFRADLWPPVTVTRTLSDEFADELPRSAFQTGWHQFTEHGVTKVTTTYHPHSHLWPLQLVETGLLLALTAAATGACYLLLRRRTR
ncbi:hypothetical protein AB0K93_11185 [Streptomyces sp. NPDC052676]|uniref:hypothetical protein n=1 Tax=Streptomyces sp. NPDC052676 TaxID=3154953 RepID=UPI0034486527